MEQRLCLKHAFSEKSSDALYTSTKCCQKTQTIFLNRSQKGGNYTRAIAISPNKHMQIS